MATPRKNGSLSKALRNLFYLFFLLRVYVLRFGKPLNNSVTYVPFFIVGAGRSGNTLLRRVLNNHEDVYIPPETYVLGSVIRKYTLYFFLPWNNLVDIVFDEFEQHPEFKTFNINSLQSLKKRCSICEKKDRSLTFLINAFYEEYKACNQIESKIWGDKTPLNTMSIDMLAVLFPKAKFIHMKRNVFDVVASYLKAGLYQNVIDSTNRWADSEQIMERFESKHPKRVITVRYENLVSNPKVEVERCSTYLGLDFKDEMLSDLSNITNMGDVTSLQHHKNVSKPITSKSVGKGMKELSNDNILLIKNILRLKKLKI